MGKIIKSSGPTSVKTSAKTSAKHEETGNHCGGAKRSWVPNPPPCVRGCGGLETDHGFETTSEG